MNRRTFAILAVVVVLLAGIAYLSQRGGDTASIAGASAGELFVPGLADRLEDITAIEVTGAGDARLVRIERAGEQWVVAEQDGYPADTGPVTGLLIALAEARILEEKTADPAFHSRLGVEAVDSAEATGLEVALTGDDGASFEVVLGDAYGADQRYARLAASEQSVLVDRNPDVARRSRAVQYVSMPAHGWEPLRNQFPGKYEAAVNPVPDPDAWFHARIVVADRTVSVFVNDAKDPCVVVTELSDRRGGMVGLWVGNGSAGDFANLRITPANPG